MGVERWMGGGILRIFFDERIFFLIKKGFFVLRLKLFSYICARKLRRNKVKNASFFSWIHHK